MTLSFHHSNTSSVSRTFTLQDAIDFIVFLVKATAEMLRFSDGTIASPGAFPTVGGPIDIAVLQPNGITWVQTKSLVGERPSPLSAPHRSEMASCLD